MHIATTGTLTAARATSGAQRCLVCSSESVAKGPRRFLRCAGCGLLFASDMQAGDAEWYRRTWIYTGSRTAKPLSREAIEANWAWGLFLRQPPLSRGTLLDVGCGRGDFLHAAQLQGFAVAGVDFQKELAQIGRELYGLSISCSDIWQVLNDGRRFDIVTAFEVLEHVAEPVAFLSTLGRIGRYVVASVPCADRRPPLFARGFDDPPHHLTMWTPAALERALVQAGLRVLVLRGDRYHPAHLGIYVSCLAGGRYPLGRYVRGALRRLGTWLGRHLPSSQDGPFTLFVIAKPDRPLAASEEWSALA